MSRQHRVTWLMAALICAIASIASAQSGTSTLQGKVLDAQKAALPGATATLANAETGFSREAVSDAAGTFVFSAVPPGTYSLTVALTGFKTSVADKVTLQVDTITELNVGLEIGSLAESIQVSAEAPVINTSDASIGNVITGNQIRQLPLEGRNVVGLLSLQPGVTYVPKADPGATMDPRYGSVSGARADQSTVTLDGIDVNDQDRQTAFTSVLRVTLDSVQEFRVTTSNYGADQGRSSGAQVSLVTRSGTNDYHGAGYYVNRNTAFSSNEYFLKLSQLAEGLESKPPKLDKNIYGFSIGGPIRKDKLFFFGNFEGLNDSRETVVTRAVPSDSLRDGVLMYECANPAQCPGGTVQGLTGSHPVPAGSYGMSPAEVARVDPLHIGPSLAASQYFKQFPSANTEGRYPGNIDDYRFGAPIENRFRTYIFRGDYRLNGQNSFFGRLNKQDDKVNSTPQYLGNDPNRSRTDKNWGTALGWDSTFGGNVVNTFRYGYTKIDSDTVGLQRADFTSFRFIDSLEFDAANGSVDNGRAITTHNFVDDISMVKGRHTLKFGGNMRFVRNDNYTFANSYITGNANGSWVAGVGRRYRPGGACPPPADCSGLPAVASTSISSYGDSIIPLLGVISQTNVVYNNTLDGQVLAGGTPVNRLYGANEFELYAQDSWHVTDNLTVSAGIRYGLYSPPWEVNGQQVATTFALGDWFDDRAAGMQNGVPSNQSPQITFVPGGPANDAPGYYEWDKNNFAPRVAAAWTPSPTWVVRGGYGIVYDRIGAGLASTFDTFGSFGLSNNLDSPFGGNNETNPDVRFTSTGVVPATYPDAPPTGFPATPEVDTGAITSSLDQSIKTPYSHVFNIIVGKELGRSYGIEAGYVGRRGRSLLVRRDIAMPLNLKDPASGIDYFTAARQLVDAYNAAGGDVALVARQPYWENLFPEAAFDGLTATQNMAASFGGNAPDYITALYNLDKFCDPACSRFGPNSFFAEQYDSLAAQSSLGYSDYDALQLTLRRRYSQGYQFDLNYTLARGRDNGSQVERGSAFDNNPGQGGYSGFLVNSFDPDLNYSYADFDVRHQINVNWLAELPFGQGKHWGSGAGTAMNALIGDWAVSGIGRWSSGYPFNVINCRSCWATNWNLQGNAALAQPGVLPEMQTTRDAVNGQPSPFADPQDALTFFRNLYPGEAGIRNELRGDGYFAIDLSIAKGFRLPAAQRIEFRWDIFNLTNTPKFDTGDVTMFPDSAASFGRYDSSLAACDGAAGRCMQLNLRYTF